MTEYEMYESGMSIHEVHEATGIALSTLRNRFKKAGILRSRIEGIKNASKRNRLGVGLRGKKEYSQKNTKTIYLNPKRARAVDIEFVLTGILNTQWEKIKEDWSI